MKKLFALVVAVAMIFTVLAVSASAATATYKIQYSSNSAAGGKGFKQESGFTLGQEVEVNPADPEKFYNTNPVLVFSHWTDINGNEYYVGDKITVSEDLANARGVIILTAQWKAGDPVRITYDKNTTDPSCTGNVADNNVYAAGNKITIIAVNNYPNDYQYPMYTFIEWNTKPDGTGDSYNPGDEFVLNENTTMYAIWEYTGQEVVFYTVKFDANGGEGEMFDETDIVAGGSIMAPDCEFTYEGYVFENWNTKADGTGETYEAWDDVPVDADMTLYAMWIEGEDWMYNPDDGEAANIAVAVAVSALALGALVVVAKKEIED